MCKVLFVPFCSQTKTIHVTYCKTIIYKKARKQSMRIRQVKKRYKGQKSWNNRCRYNPILFIEKHPKQYILIILRTIELASDSFC